MRGNKVVKINLERKKKDESKSITETKSLVDLSSLPDNLLKDSPFFPNEAPFSENQKLWISGFLAGLKHSSSQKQNQSNTKEEVKINFLFGTQTGNSETIAETAAEIAQNNNFSTKLAPLDDVSMEALQNMENAVFVVSTYGEGEMPDNAHLFWESLSSSTAPKLENLNFGVLALGDTGYDEFCNAGKMIDVRLEQLGAKRLIKRVDCDVDFETLSNEWIDKIIPRFNKDEKIELKKKEIDESKIIWNKKTPYMAEISKNKVLSGSGSNKEIRHYEIELGDSGITYEVGDTLNVIPQNNQKLVNLLLKKLHIDENFIPSGENETMQNLLLKKYEISTPNKMLIEEIIKKSKNIDVRKILASNDKEKLDSFLWGKDILDLLNLDEKINFESEEFLGSLKPLQPRAYSISSSLKMHQNQVHLTISAVRWSEKERIHNGVCSTYLADMKSPFTKIGVYISQNKSFRVPENDSVPIIMIGPGTGIAPFRAFLEERKVRGGNGKNWLFFGDQTRKNDFIYEEEIIGFKNSGILTKLDLAFSRDQKEKVYVQHKMLESSKKFFTWLEDGAYIYVCGDAKFMAKDVDNAIHEIIQKEGRLKPESAKEYVNDLKRQKRYLRDVY